MTMQARVLRAVDRKRVLLKASFITVDGTLEVRVYDLTVSGARIACDRVLPAGEDVVFKRGGLFAPARIVWSNRAGMGISFYREIPASDLAATFHTVFETAEPGG